MADDWLNLYDEFSTKVVSNTDKSKGAYVVNAAQKAIMLTAGVSPTEGPSDRILQIGVLGSENGQLSVSYYNSIRQGAGRVPETRMGREIVAWVEVGDNLTMMLRTRIPTSLAGNSQSQLMPPKFLLRQSNELDRPRGG
jgi:hypothetical protein